MTRTGILLASAMVCFAQGKVSLVPPSDLARQREAIERAWSRWQSGDDGLERDIFTIPQAETLKTIEKGERLSAEYFRTRTVFIETVANSVREALADAQANALPVSAARGDDEDRRLRSVLEERRRMDKTRDRNDVPAGARTLDREERKRESDLLRSVAEKIEAQRRLVRLASDSAREQEKARKGLIASYRQVLGLLEEDATTNNAKQQLWADYYDSLREMVEPKESATESSAPARPKPAAKPKKR